MNELLTGKHLNGEPSDIDRERILDQVIVSVIPDANPDGRSRSPERFWDGSRWSNDEFWCWMRGKDRETGKMWKRLGLWSTRMEKDHPTPVGIVYEQISDHEYVEPNRSKRSSLFRLVKLLRDRHEYEQMLSLHQTEFVNSEYNCMVILPTLQDELSEERQRYNREWAEEVVEAWGCAGGNPVPESKPLGYKGEQREYFVRVWGDLYHKVAVITSEVQNNNSRTPPEMQMRLSETALRASVERLLR